MNSDNPFELINIVYCKLKEYIDKPIGDLNLLQTTNKSNLVSAINELKLSGSSEVRFNYVNEINLEYNSIN